MKIQDLDVLRPEPRIVRLGGKDIDVSFIPCGITFDIDAIMRELVTIDASKAGAGGDESRRAFNLSIKLCATFCKFRHPELDEDWFMENVDPMQIRAFSEAIKEALTKAYAGIDEPKKAVAAKKR